METPCALCCGETVGWSVAAGAASLRAVTTIGGVGNDMTTLRQRPQHQDRCIGQLGTTWLVHSSKDFKIVLSIIYFFGNFGYLQMVRFPIETGESGFLPFLETPMSMIIERWWELCSENPVVTSWGGLRISHNQTLTAWNTCCHQVFSGEDEAAMGDIASMEI